MPILGVPVDCCCNIVYNAFVTLTVRCYGVGCITDVRFTFPATCVTPLTLRVLSPDVTTLYTLDVTLPLVIVPPPGRTLYCVPFDCNDCPISRLPLTFTGYLPHVVDSIVHLYVCYDLIVWLTCIWYYLVCPLLLAVLPARLCHCNYV